jgi:hypothetical protein
VLQNSVDFPAGLVAKGFRGKRVEFPGFYVSLDLAIPCSSIKLGEPSPKLCKFLSRETGEVLLEGFEFTHRRNYYHCSFRGVSSPREQLRRVPFTNAFQRRTPLEVYNHVSSGAGHERCRAGLLS